jgi:hypothetical protein
MNPCGVVASSQPALPISAAYSNSIRKECRITKSAAPA